MPEFQEDHEFQCPYCASEISVVIDLTGGHEQSFTSDCEVCCRPILIHVVVDGDDIIEFRADRESD